MTAARPKDSTDSSRQRVNEGEYIHKRDSKDRGRGRDSGTGEAEMSTSLSE